MHPSHFLCLTVPFQAFERPSNLTVRVCCHCPISSTKQFFVKAFSTSWQSLACEFIRTFEYISSKFYQPRVHLFLILSTVGYPKSRPSFPPPGFNESICALPSSTGNCRDRVGRQTHPGSFFKEIISWVLEKKTDVRVFVKRILKGLQLPNFW